MNQERQFHAIMGWHHSGRTRYTLLKAQEIANGRKIIVIAPSIPHMDTLVSITLDILQFELFKGYGGLTVITDSVKEYSQKKDQYVVAFLFDEFYEKDHKHCYRLIDALAESELDVVMSMEGTTETSKRYLGIENRYIYNMLPMGAKLHITEKLPTYHKKFEDHHKLTYVGERHPFNI